MKSPNISMIRAALLASIAVSGLAVTAPVMAQEEAASAESGDEIIVTARRREEMGHTGFRLVGGRIG